ncbi:MAG: tetratricopeptide repeat protein [Flammeovirgaceae bacterium]|nr:tetratricopeptide repeat protein [Flammeovirgaceae bacterium]
MGKSVLWVIMMLIPSIGFTQRTLAFRHCESGEKFAEEKKYDKALEELTNCLVLDPLNKEMYLLRASIHSNVGKAKEAITDYNIYIDLDPANRNAYYGRAIIHYQLKQYEMARSDFRQLLSMENSEINNTLYYRINTESGGVDQMFTQHEAKDDPIFNYLGLIEFQLKENLRAIDYFNKAISINSNEPDYYFNRGLAFEASSLDSMALMDYQLALLINPEHSISQQRVATLGEKSGDQINSGFLDQIIEDNPNALSAYIDRAYKHLQQRNYAAAVEDYTMAIQLDSSNYELWLNRGIAKENRNDYVGAYQDYTQSINRNEGYSKGWLNRANILAKLNRYDDAITDYTIAIFMMHLMHWLITTVPLPDLILIKKKKHARIY